MRDTDVRRGRDEVRRRLAIREKKKKVAFSGLRQSRLVSARLWKKKGAGGGARKRALLPARSGEAIGRVERPGQGAVTPMESAPYQIEKWAGKSRTLKHLLSCKSRHLFFPEI